MVWQANNGTIFHTRKFLAYHPQDRFIDHSLIFCKKNKPYVLLPAAEVINVQDKMLISHPGASMGSFVVPEDLSILTHLNWWMRLIVTPKPGIFWGKNYPTTNYL
ncbi:MAG: hypothetical protein CM1200mP10_19220 [Candidatus Neomarinimicrobiota bacterium]|nr:MAG: hypothetical protein CM1200mP10_19220 [Candidatus Neomarinimicrobiota bacterium]